MLVQALRLRIIDVCGFTIELDRSALRHSWTPGTRFKTANEFRERSNCQSPIAGAAGAAGATGASPDFVYYCSFIKNIYLSFLSSKETQCEQRFIS